MIHVEDALRAVRGEVNKRRECDIDEAFDSLLLDADGDNGKDCDTLDPAAVATRFRAEAHPDAASGVRPQRDILSEFLEAFDGECVVSLSRFRKCSTLGGRVYC